ncbi:hypothetical protein GCM10011324_04470 [Allosediminivita pacifica]|nr:hypothetical protein GCM10011324_04470 [Allosediminivita pacifica]
MSWKGSFQTFAARCLNGSFGDTQAPWSMTRHRCSTAAASVGKRSTLLAVSLRRRQALETPGLEFRKAAAVGWLRPRDQLAFRIAANRASGMDRPAAPPRPALPRDILNKVLIHLCNPLKFLGRQSVPARDTLNGHP